MVASILEKKDPPSRLEHAARNRYLKQHVLFVVLGRYRKLRHAKAQYLDVVIVVTCALAPPEASDHSSLSNLPTNCSLGTTGLLYISLLILGANIVVLATIDLSKNARDEVDAVLDIKAHNAGSANAVRVAPTGKPSENEVAKLIGVIGGTTRVYKT